MPPCLHSFSTVLWPIWPFGIHAPYTKITKGKNSGDSPAWRFRVLRCCIYSLIACISDNLLDFQAISLNFGGFNAAAAACVLRGFRFLGVHHFRLLRESLLPCTSIPVRFKNSVSRSAPRPANSREFGRNDSYFAISDITMF